MTTRLVLSPPLDESPETVRALLAPLRHDFSIALHAAGNAFAVGAIIRVAHNFLARELVLIGDAPHYEKASMGMEKYESIERVPDDEALFSRFADRPIWAVEKDFARASLYDVSEFPRDVVFVFGSERFGLSREFCERCQNTIAIPIYGVNKSLPLAIASGIVMNEWARNRHVNRNR